MCVGDEFDQVPWEQVAGRDMHRRAYDAMMARIAAGETVEVEHDPPAAHALHDIFVSYHAPDADQIEAITAVRKSVEEIIATLLTHVPDCADRTAAVRKVREAMMAAKVAIVLKGAV
jgi:hypothetical protein